jgi:hypothetical protein
VSDDKVVRRPNPDWWDQCRFDRSRVPPGLRWVRLRRPRPERPADVIRFRPLSSRTGEAPSADVEQPVLQEPTSPAQPPAPPLPLPRVRRRISMSAEEEQEAIAQKALREARWSARSRRILRSLIRTIVRSVSRGR